MLSFVRLQCIPIRVKNVTSYSLTRKTLSQIVHLSRVYPSDSCTSPSPTHRFVHSCFHGGRKPTPPLCACDDHSHPALMLWTSLLWSQYVCSPSRSLRPSDRPLLKSPCVAVVHLPGVTPAMELFFYFSLRSASQQAASNCYIFSWQEETAHITFRDVAQQ